MLESVVELAINKSKGKSPLGRDYKHIRINPDKLHLIINTTSLFDNNNSTNILRKLEKYSKDDEVYLLTNKQVDEFTAYDIASKAAKFKIIKISDTHHISHDKQNAFLDMHPTQSRIYIALGHRYDLVMVKKTELDNLFHKDKDAAKK